MRKALIPMLASLALCGAGTAALIASNGRAQASPRKPVMVALLGDPLMAQNLPDTPPPPNARDTSSDASRDFAPDPRQFCDERYAGEVGRMAYLETRLHLTDAEQPLFAHWKEVRLDSAKRQAADCAARTGADPDRTDPVARMSREEAMLKQRISDLDAERPAFSALYATLAPDQRQTLAPPRPMMGRDHGPMPREVGDLPPPPPPVP
jgi:hypothetical protein